MDDYSKIKGLKIGITGCSGVLGNRLVQALSSYGANLSCLVRQNSKVDSIKGLNPLLVNGDITDKESLRDFVKGLDVCIHLAAMVGQGSRKEYNNVNVVGTKNLCESIIENNPNCRFINCSSIAALRIKKWVKPEFTNYAKSKKMADDVVGEVTKKTGLKSTTIYPGLFYGPCDTKFIPSIIKNIQSGKVFFLTGGEKDAPLIFIDDLCDLFVKAVINENAIGKRYIGVGLNEIGIHDFFKILAKKTSCPEPSKVKHKLPYLTAAVILEKIYGLLHLKKSPPITKRMVDILSINFRKEEYGCDNDIGWSPKTNIEQGLAKYFEWKSLNKQ
jgi:nucleoside-diphosphate-sugar epimerase